MEFKRYGPYRNKLGYEFFTDRYADGTKKSVWVHREVAAQMLGRPLRRDEHVHHRDHDPSNNDPMNLEVLPRREHLAQHGRRKGTFITVICPMCGREATMPARYVRHNRKLGKKGPFCGRSCAGKWSHIKTWPMEPPAA